MGSLGVGIRAPQRLRLGVGKKESTSLRAPKTSYSKQPVKGGYRAQALPHKNAAQTFPRVPSALSTQSSQGQICNARYHNAKHIRVRSAAQDLDSATDMKTFCENLASASDVELGAYVDSSPLRGSGLFAKRDFARGDVILSIPLAVCLILARDPEGRQVTSWRGPEAEWPRTKAALELHYSTGLPWDLVCGVMLVDAVEGRGGAFFEKYSSLLPDRIEVPFCMPDKVISQLQHPEIEAGARAQKERLRTLLPDLALADEDEASTGTLPWGFACTRSRAFFLGGNYFAFVPFLDLANHGESHNSEYGVVNNTHVQLVASREVKAGSEVLLSYSGGEAYNSQRFMAQYGFTLLEGNVNDRVPFTAPSGLEGAALSIEKMQDLIGDKGWMDMMMRKDDVLYACVKSVPLTEDLEIDGAQEQALAQNLLQQCHEQIQKFITTTEEDLQLLKEAKEGASSQMVAAIEYRLSRKTLWERCACLLEDYCAV